MKAEKRQGQDDKRKIWYNEKNKRFGGWTVNGTL